MDHDYLAAQRAYFWVPYVDLQATRINFQQYGDSAAPTGGSYKNRISDF